MTDNTTITNAALAVDIARIGERLEGLGEDLHRVQATLDGFLNGNNGRPGVIERLALSEQAIIGLSVRVVAIESTERESAKLPWKVILAIIGVTGTLATGLVTIITKMI